MLDTMINYILIMLSVLFGGMVLILAIGAAWRIYGVTERLEARWPGLRSYADRQRGRS